MQLNHTIDLEFLEGDVASAASVAASASVEDAVAAVAASVEDTAFDEDTVDEVAVDEDTVAASVDHVEDAITLNETLLEEKTMTGGNKRATRHGYGRKRRTMHKRQSSSRKTRKRVLKSCLKSTKRIH